MTGQRWQRRCTAVTSVVSMFVWKHLHDCWSWYSNPEAWHCDRLPCIHCWVFAADFSWPFAVITAPILTCMNAPPRKSVCSGGRSNRATLGCLLRQHVAHSTGVCCLSGLAVLCPQDWQACSRSSCKLYLRCAAAHTLLWALPGLLCAGDAGLQGEAAAVTNCHSGAYAKVVGGAMGLYGTASMAAVA